MNSTYPTQTLWLLFKIVAQTKKKNTLKKNPLQLNRLDGGVALPCDTGHAGGAERRFTADDWGADDGGTTSSDGGSAAPPTSKDKFRVKLYLDKFQALKRRDSQTLTMAQNAIVILIGEDGAGA